MNYELRIRNNKTKNLNSLLYIPNSPKISGFTLIELLVVVSIIGLLMGLTMIAIAGARQGARDAKRKSDLESLRSGLELYKADCKQYPTQDILAATNLVGSGVIASCAVGNTYISQMPVDTQSPTKAYRYSASVQGTTYEICASLEGGGTTVTCGGSSTCGTSTCNYKVINP